MNYKLGEPTFCVFRTEIGVEGNSAAGTQSHSWRE